MSGPHLLHLLPRCIGGGPERSVVATAREAARLGIDRRETMVVLDPPATPVMLMSSRRAGVQLVTRFDADGLRALVDDSDLVVLHFWNHPALFELLAAVELPPCRVVTIAHVRGLDAPQVLTADLGRFGDVLMVTSADSLVSEGARAASDAGIAVEVMPSILDRSRLDGFEPRPHDGIVVGYFGSLSPAKLHRRFVELCAAVDHPDVRFVVYGSGGDPQRLQDHFDAAGLAGRVEVHGPVEDLRVAFAEMDLLGYPLEPGGYATSDRALREAMWAGVPPVVLGDSAPAVLVEHGRSGLVVDTDGYPAAVRRLADDPVLRARLAVGAAESARERFDPATDTRRFMDMVARTVALPRRARPVLPGAGERPADRFVRALGDQASHFAVSCGRSPGDVDAADNAIGAAPAVLAGGEGGVIHYRNTYPDDPHLRLWSGLIAAAGGNPDLAADEFAAAGALGLGDDRPARYRHRLPGAMG